MKTIKIIMLISITLCSLQLFGKKESVTIYNIKFSAKEITGQNKFNSTSDYYHTPILDPLFEKNTMIYLYELGSYRTDIENNETLGLFNMSLQNESYPFLDKIDFAFYKALGLQLVENKSPELVNNESYKKIKWIIQTDSINIAEKKKRLFNTDEYTAVKNMLVLSRYDVIAKDFSVDVKKDSKLTVELKAKLDSIVVHNNVTLTSDFHAYLSRLTDESTKITGIYYDARLSKGYIDKINYYVNTANESDVGSDNFGYNLKNYVANNNAAVNTGLVAIQLTGTYDKTKITVDSIAFDLQSKFNISPQIAKSIAVGINITFSKKETITLKNNFSSVFIVRFFTSKIIDSISFKKLKEIYNLN